MNMSRCKYHRTACCEAVHLLLVQYYCYDMTTRSARSVSVYENEQKLASTVLESDMTKLLMHA